MDLSIDEAAKVLMTVHQLLKNDESGILIIIIHQFEMGLIPDLSNQFRVKLKNHMLLELINVK